MNKDDRSSLSDVKEILEEAGSCIEDMQKAEQAKFNNLPEGLQASERGQSYQEASDTLGSALDSLYEAISSLEDLGA